MTTVFDAPKYKATTRDQWQSAADAWNAWGPTLRSWLGPATELMLDMARIGDGASVLDVAAGAGDQTMQAAKRVGPRGRLLATDIAPDLLAHCAANARIGGMTNVATLVADGEDLPVPEASFDAVISRVGLIYFPDQFKALRSMHRALRDGGWVGAIVYATAEENKFFSVPVSIIRRRASLPPPLPGQPGPFSLGNPGTIEDLFTAAGFRNVSARKIPSDLVMPSAADCLRFEKESFGALHQMLAGLDDHDQSEAWTEIEQALRGFEGPNGFVGPCTLVVAAGQK
jgi:ubiquinone/menaquinone biosynthesis C-methylase UbiE